MTDIEAWKKVNQLWSSHGLEKTDTMGLDSARPFMEEYIKEIKNVDSVDEGLLMHIFNTSLKIPFGCKCMGAMLTPVRS